MKKTVVVLIVIFSLLVLYYWRTRDLLLQVKYDMTHPNSRVASKEAIDDLFSQFETQNYSDLSAEYLQQTNQDLAPFKGMVAQSVFFKIPQKMVYQKIVGNFRVKHFLPKDDYYKQALYSRDDSILFILDKEMIFQVFEFQELLDEAGHNQDAFIITNGYRHPAYNKLVGGASQSRHIVGEAVDITARDINNDGKANQLDKAIILQIAETVVGENGGVGKYPNTLSIHMDTRGYKARWDSF